MINLAHVTLDLRTTRMLPLSAQIAQPLKTLGFTKKSNSWWRQSQDAVQVLNIQKSQFGERIHINLGIYLKALGTETTPPERRCHVQVRLEDVADQGLWNEIASATADSEPTPSLVAAVVQEGCAWLSRLSTLAGVRDYIESDASKNALVFASVRELLTA
jgi:hypothetical protein